jgi:hypothetical protein
MLVLGTPLARAPAIRGEDSLQERWTERKERKEFRGAKAEHELPRGGYRADAQGVRSCRRCQRSVQRKAEHKPITSRFSTAAICGEAYLEKSRAPQRPSCGFPGKQRGRVELQGVPGAPGKAVAPRRCWKCSHLRSR